MDYHPGIVIDNWLVITEDFVIIFPVSEHDSYHLLYLTVCIWPDRPEQRAPVA